MEGDVSDANLEIEEPSALPIASSSSSSILSSSSTNTTPNSSAFLKLALPLADSFFKILPTMEHNHTLAPILFEFALGLREVLSCWLVNDLHSMALEAVGGHCARIAEKLEPFRAKIPVKWRWPLEVRHGTAKKQEWVTLSYIHSKMQTLYFYHPKEDKLVELELAAVVAVLPLLSPSSGATSPNSHAHHPQSNCEFTVTVSRDGKERVDIFFRAPNAEVLNRWLRYFSAYLRKQRSQEVLMAMPDANRAAALLENVFYSSVSNNNNNNNNGNLQHNTDMMPKDFLYATEEDVWETDGVRKQRAEHEWQALTMGGKKGILDVFQVVKTSTGANSTTASTGSGASGASGGKHSYQIEVHLPAVNRASAIAGMAAGAAPASAPGGLRERGRTGSLVSRMLNLDGGGGGGGASSNAGNNSSMLSGGSGGLNPGSGGNWSNSSLLGEAWWRKQPRVVVSKSKENYVFFYKDFIDFRAHPASLEIDLVFCENYYPLQGTPPAAAASSNINSNSIVTACLGGSGPTGLPFFQRRFQFSAADNFKRCCLLLTAFSRGQRGVGERERDLTAVNQMTKDKESFFLLDANIHKLIGLEYTGPAPQKPGASGGNGNNGGAAAHSHSRSAHSISRSASPFPAASSSSYSYSSYSSPPVFSTSAALSSLLAPSSSASASLSLSLSVSPSVSSSAAGGLNVKNNNNNPPNNGNNKPNSGTTIANNNHSNNGNHSNNSNNNFFAAALASMNTSPSTSTSSSGSSALPHSVSSPAVSAVSAASAAANANASGNSGNSGGSASNAASHSTHPPPAAAGAGNDLTKKKFSMKFWGSGGKGEAGAASGTTATVKSPGTASRGASGNSEVPPGGAPGTAQADAGEIWKKMFGAEIGELGYPMMAGGEDDGEEDEEDDVSALAGPGGPSREIPISALDAAAGVGLQQTTKKEEEEEEEEDDDDDLDDDRF